MIRIAVTGHRKLQNEKEVRAQIALRLQAYQEKYGVVEAVSALAEGADTIFAEEAIRLNLRLRFLIPFPLAEYLKDFDTDGQATLQKLIESNGGQFEVVTVEIPADAEERNRAYLMVGKKLVDTTDMLVAVWDGKSALGKGGTGDIVNYARKQGKFIDIIKAVRPGMETKSVFFDALQTYDKEAVRLKKIFDWGFWKGGIAFGVAAVFIFAVSISFPKYLSDDLKGLWLPVFETTFVFLSFIFLGFFAPKFKPLFLTKRHFAEYLRAHDFMVNCGFTINRERENHKDFRKPDDISELETRFSPDPSAALDIEAAKARLTTFIDYQNEYHTEIRIEGYEKTEHFYELLLKCILWFFAGVAVAKLVFELMEYYHSHFIHEHEYLLSVCKFFIIFLPPLYAAIEGVIYLSDWKLNIRISEEINERYNDLKRRITATQDMKELEVLAKELDHCFWKEQFGWLVWFHGKKIEARV